MADKAMTASYGRYASRNKMLLAELDYTMQRTPSIPLLRHDPCVQGHGAAQDVRGLPALYRRFKLKGRA